jgi:LPXTG-motif cell wall-anchored protein
MNGEIVMKKISVVLFLIIAIIQAGFVASAQGVVPTGETINIVPYILGIIALILIAAFAWLTYLSKKNK